MISHNLALAVLTGIIISALSFVWDLSKRLWINKYTDAEGILHYEIHGTLFFGSVTSFQEHFDARNDPATIVIDLSKSRVADLSAIEGINELIGRYERAGKKIVSKQ